MLVVMVCTSLPFTSLRPLPPLPRSDVCGQHGESRWQHAEPEYRWHQGGRGAPEAEVREVPWCCVDGLLSQTEPKIMRWAISVTKPTVYRAAVYYSILYQLAFVYFVIYKLGFTNGFNIFDCSPINERQSWCVSPALDLNPHIYGICKTVIPNLSDQKYGIGTCIWGDQILTLPIFTRNDQTKCPAK